MAQPITRLFKWGLPFLSVRDVQRVEVCSKGTAAHVRTIVPQQWEPELERQIGAYIDPKMRKSNISRLAHFIATRLPRLILQEQHFWIDATPEGPPYPFAGATFPSGKKRAWFILNGLQDLCLQGDMGKVDAARATLFAFNPYDLAGERTGERFWCRRVPANDPCVKSETALLEQVNQQISSENILQTFYIREIGQKPALPAYFIEQRPSEGDLSGFCKQAMQLSLNRRAYIAQKLIESIADLHTPRELLMHTGNVVTAVLHRDIRPQNIYINRVPTEPGKCRYEPLLGGFARGIWTFKALQPSFSPTDLRWSAPEIAWTAATKESDVYSLGLVCYQILTGEEPPVVRELTGLDPAEVERRLKEGQITRFKSLRDSAVFKKQFPKGKNRDLDNFVGVLDGIVCGMTATVPERRPTLNQVCATIQVCFGDK